LVAVGHPAEAIECWVVAGKGKKTASAAKELDASDGRRPVVPARHGEGGPTPRRRYLQRKTQSWRTLTRPRSSGGSSTPASICGVPPGYHRNLN